MPTRPHAPRGGFTLIEVLLVIGVIALLVGILMPTLGGARETGWQTVCLSNTRQISMAAFNYAQDNRELIWPADQWARVTIPGQPGLHPGLFYQYCDRSGRITTCPKNRRRGKHARERTNPTTYDLFRSQYFLDFDYTMIDEIQGYRLGTPTEMWRLATPANPPGRVITGPDPAVDLVLLRNVWMYVEESTYIYNEDFPDGRFGNDDQVTMRHPAGKGKQGGGHVAYVDGSAEMVVMPQGTRETLPLEPTADFEANHLYARRQGGTHFFQVSDWNQPYGWINQPR